MYTRFNSFFRQNVNYLGNSKIKRGILVLFNAIIASQIIHSNIKNSILHTKSENENNSNVSIDDKHSDTNWNINPDKPIIEIEYHSTIIRVIRNNIAKESVDAIGKNGFKLNS